MKIRTGAVAGETERTTAVGAAPVSWLATVWPMLRGSAAPLMTLSALSSASWQSAHAADAGTRLPSLSLFQAKTAPAALVHVLRPASSAAVMTPSRSLSTESLAVAL